MDREILAFLHERKVLPRPDVFTFLRGEQDPLGTLRRALDALGEPPAMLSAADLRLVLQGTGGPVPVPAPAPSPAPIMSPQPSPSASRPSASPVSPPAAAPSYPFPSTARSESVSVPRDAPGDAAPQPPGIEVHVIGEAELTTAPDPSLGRAPRVSPLPEWRGPRAPSDSPGGAVHDDGETEEEEDGEGSGEEEPGGAGATDPTNAPDAGQRPGPPVRPAAGFRALARDVAPQITVLHDVTVETARGSNAADFARFFGDRLRRIRRILTGRMELRGASGIERAVQKGGDARIIGIVSDLRPMRGGGGVWAELEDETGNVTVAVGPDLGEAHLVRDEVVGVVGFVDSNGRIRAKQVLRPETPARRTPNRSQEAVCAAFISDIHVGSKTFLAGGFRNFLRWLNGHVDVERELAGRIKYLCLVGDIVDGVGIYPNQGPDLAVGVLQEQYEILADYLQSVPDHIQIIAVPGNHDAVRQAEPQPTFPQEVRKLFDSRVTFLGNPATVQLHGVEVLLYHGRGMDAIIPNIPHLSYARPLDAMKEMLARRHLAPIYGDRVPLAPERRDQLVIEQVPDIFVTGHVHAAQADYHRGVLIANSSTWQSQTSYQKSMNFVPDPMKVLVADLSTVTGRWVKFGA